MIEPYVTEQYLPCNQSELFGMDRRQEIPFANSSLKLKYNITVLPMHVGFLLHVHSTNGTRVLYADKTTMEVLKVVADGSSTDFFNSHTDYRDELERLNYYGLLSSDGNTEGHLDIRTVPDEIERIYLNGDFGWFSYSPTKIELDLSSLCNFSCIHCSRNALPHITPERQELTIAELRRVVAEAAEVGVISLQIMGGEPLAYKHFFEICEFAKTCGIQHLNTSSNGWLINNKDIASQLAMYFREVQLSLHGSIASTHDAIVGKEGSWERVRQAARYLVDCGIKVRLSFTVMEQNIDEIELMPQLARDIGASSLRYLALSNQGRGKNLKELTKADRASIGMRIKALATQETMRHDASVNIECGGFPPLTELRTNAQFYGCPAGRELLYVSADGSVSCCGVIEEYIGNVRDMSIQQLWHHPKMVQVRVAPRCDCEYRLICSGPCIAGFYNPYDEKVKIF